MRDLFRGVYKILRLKFSTFQGVGAQLIFHSYRGRGGGFNPSDTTFTPSDTRY